MPLFRGTSSRARKAALWLMRSRNKTVYVTILKKKCKLKRFALPFHSYRKEGLSHTHSVPEEYVLFFGGSSFASLHKSPLSPLDVRVTYNTSTRIVGCITLRV